MRDYLRRTKKFADLILFAWANIEANFTMAVASEFGLHHTDDKAKFLESELTFEQKKHFLKQQAVWADEVLTKEERRAIENSKSLGVTSFTTWHHRNLDSAPCRKSTSWIKQ